ncbi:MAG: hypothetical protein ACI8W3_000603 [Myxococcota bacterium]|jgi:hypothetical protein
MSDFETTPRNAARESSDERQRGTPRRSAMALLWLGLLLAFVALRAMAIFTESVNWDEFNLIHNAAWTLQSGELHAGGRPGLAVLNLLPFVAECDNEIDVVRRARGYWMLVSLAGLFGLGMLIREFNRDSARRNFDALLGVSLLALVPDYLIWSLQVRADQIAIALALWGGVALLASRRHGGWATAAGMLFGLGFLASQKAVYLIALAGLLALADIARKRDWTVSRDGMRGVLCLSSMGMIVVGFYALIPQLWGGNAADPGAALSAQLPAINAATAGRQYNFQMGVFDYYRSTIGYSQYKEMLPTLLPHACLALLMIAASARLAWGRRSLPAALVAAWAVVALGVGVGLFHAGAFKYFWMTLGIFPAVAFVLARGSIEELSSGLPATARRCAFALFCAALALPAVVQSVELLEDTQAVQRDTFDFARRNFSLSDAGFQAEAGLFCSDDANRFPPYFSQLIERKFSATSGCVDCAPKLIEKFEQEQVKFVVASFRLTQFPPIVQSFWQDNYLPYNGALLVAGKFLRAEQNKGEVSLVVDGDYLWLPNNPPAQVAIDGHPVLTGQRVTLGRGSHTLSFPDEKTEGMLVLAMDAPPKVPLQPFYKPF